MVWCSAKSGLTVAVFPDLGKVFVVECTGKPHPVEGCCFPVHHAFQCFGKVVDV